VTSATFTVGSLVRARGREWVVLPDSADDRNPPPRKKTVPRSGPLPNSR
jgi:hypothetical protein